jgi:hypothetical protein
MLGGSKVMQTKESKISIQFSSVGAVFSARGVGRIMFSGCQTLSVLLFLHFLYSDDLLAIWDRRVSTAVEQDLPKLRIKPSEIKLELQALADILELPLLARAIEPLAKCMPGLSVAQSMENLFNAVQTSDSLILRKSYLSPDVTLQLADKNVPCHSTILRARSVFFADLFDEEDWTAKRWDENGMITVDMKHLKWHVVEYILRFICGGDEEMFENLGTSSPVYNLCSI